jgi:hypothetical protein
MSWNWYDYEGWKGFLDVVLRVLASLAISPILGIFAKAIVYTPIIVLSIIQSAVQPILGSGFMAFNFGLPALAFSVLLSMSLNTMVWYELVGSVEHIGDALKIICLASVYVIAVIVSVT